MIINACRLTNKMVSDVARSKNKRVSAAVSSAMLDTMCWTKPLRRTYGDSIPPTGPPPSLGLVFSLLFLGGKGDLLWRKRRFLPILDRFSVSSTMTRKKRTERSLPHQIPYLLGVNNPWDFYFIYPSQPSSAQEEERDLPKATGFGASPSFLSYSGDSASDPSPSDVP